MAIIKKFSPFQNLSSFQVFINDTAPNSQYFKITEFGETFTGGKNGFLIEGSEFLKETTEVKIEILDVENTPIYYEPGDGIPEYYEGTSKLVSVHVYDDTPIGTAKITVLGELKNYVDENGAIVPVPDEWKGIYNVKWEKTFQVNKNLSNETRVRFYKRPVVSIEELVKPIFSKTVPTVTDTGTATGEALLPSAGTSLTNYRAGTSYRLTRSDGVWDRDVDENVISFSGLGYSTNIIEVLNDKQVLVDIPYSSNNIVDNFTSQSYSVSYSDFQNELIGESTLTGSFAKINITQLKTFVGDVARVKVFRKSRNAVGDFQFVQESKLESSELLRDVSTPSDTEIPYGRFDENNLSTYWITSSNEHPTSIDSSVLSQAVKFDYDVNTGGVQRLITSQSFSISKDVEYTLNFRTLLSGSLDDSGKSIKAFFSSSNFTQDFVTVSGSAIYRTRQNVSQNILSENTGDAHLVFEVSGDDWYLSNVSLKNAQDTSFSPDEFTLIQDIPRKLASETFDFRFEFYDINNNYIPVDITAVGVFDGGNDFPTSGKLLTFESDRNAFRYSSGSIRSGENQQIKFTLTQNNLTGSATFASQAYDIDGNLLLSESYAGGTYPGFLTQVTPAGALLTIDNFEGSRDDVYVGSIVYTASLDSLEEYETVYRLEDGDNAPTLLVTSNANQFIYEPTSLSPKPAGQNITIKAQRKNLASLNTPITIFARSSLGREQLTGLTKLTSIGHLDISGSIQTNEGTGESIYTISATEFSSSFASNSFDEITYEFTGSDVFGNEQSDAITISKVVNFDGVSITLSNESTAFRANGQGLILDSFDSGDGEVEVRIADKEINHSNGLSSPNTFDIVSAIATNVTESYASYLTNEYGVSGMSADSGSLVLNISYLAGDNSTTQSFQKKVNYTKNRIASPSIIIDTTNTTQNVDAKSTGVQLTSFDDSEITIREFYTGSVTTFPANAVTISFDSDGGVATYNDDLTISYDNLPNGTNSTQVLFTATVTDSEGQTRTVTDTISLSKSLKSAPNVEFQVSPSAQSISANSIGGSVSSATNLVVTANEGGSARTITFPSAPTANNGVTITSYTSATGVIVLNTSAMSADTSTVTISAEATNTEGTTVTKTLTATISKSKAATPNIEVSVTPQAQTVTSNSVGGNTSTPSSLVVKALEGTTTRLTSVDQPVGSGVTAGVPTYNGASAPYNYATIPLSSVTADNASVAIVVNYTDSEGTTGSKSLTATISRSKAAAPAIVATLNPQTQTVDSDSAFSSVGTPQNVTLVINEGGGNYGYLASGTITANKFRITAVTGGTNNNDGTITPTTPTDETGTQGVITYSYTNSEGTSFTGKTINFSVGVAVQGGDGATGPDGKRTATGLVHYQLVSTTAPATPSATSYNFSNGTFTGLTTNWALGAPTYASGNTNKYWYATYSVVETTAGGGTGVPSFGSSTQAIGFSGLVSFTANETIGDGSNNLSFGLSGTTLINGDNISTGRIISTNWDGPDTGEVFADAGMEIDLDNGKITSKNFRITSDGSAFFKGDITGASGTFSGTVTIGGTALTENNTLNSNTTSTDVGLGNVENLNAQSQAEAGLIAGTTITGGGVTLSGGGNIKGGQTGFNTGTGFFLGYSDSNYVFSIGNGSTKGITWNGATLSIAGDVQIGGTLASTVVSGAAAGSTANQDSTSTIRAVGAATSGTVGGWAIEEFQIKGGSPSGGGDGSFTTQGIRLGSDGWISSPGFYLSSGGDAFFSGVVSGSVIQGGSISIGGGTFNVNSEGALTATNATIGGSITTSDATLGAWTVDDKAISSRDGNIILNADAEYILVNDNTGTPKVTLSTDTTLPSPAATGTSVSQTLNMATQTDSRSNPSGGIPIYYNGTFTQNLNSFAAGADGNHSLTFVYNNTYGNIASATGEDSYATMAIALKLYENSNYTGLVGTSGTWTVSAWGWDATFEVSVAENTLITLSDGSLKKVKDISKVDEILVWSEKENKFTNSKIESIQSREVTSLFEVLVDGKSLQVSDTHGFWIDGAKEIKVKDIIPGETKIYVKDGDTIKFVVVDSVEEIFIESKVYTLSISKYYNYISNDIISHNAIQRFAQNDTSVMPQPQTRAFNVNLTSGNTYYPRLEASYVLYVHPWFSDDFSREASVTFNHDGVFSVNSTSSGTNINGAGLQVNASDSKVFRLNTNAANYDPFAYLLGGMAVDGFNHGFYTPRDLGTAVDSNWNNSTYTRSNLDSGTFSFAGCRAIATATFGESNNIASLQTSNYALSNIDAVTTVNANNGTSQYFSFAVITGHNAYRWTALANSYGRTAASAGDDADGLTQAESVNAHGTLISGNGASTSVWVKVIDNDSNATRYPEVLNVVCLG